MKKLAIVILCIIISTATFTFTSCNESKTGTNPNITETTSVKIETTTESTQDPSQILELPEKDWDGRVFRVLGGFDKTYDQFTNHEIAVETLTGDLVNDAVYNRNSELSDNYNVEVKQTLVEVSNTQSTAKKLILANDDVYDLVFTTIQNIPSVSANGLFIDLNDLEYIDFTKAWWREDINNSISIDGKLMFTTSDFNLKDKERAYTLIFNQDMTANLNLGNLFDVVRNGKWTLDKMAETSLAVAHDLNGDGIMDSKVDRWGVGCDSFNAFYTFVAAADNNIVTKDADDTPVINMKTDRIITSIDKVLKLLNNKETAFYCDGDKIAWDAMNNSFNAGNCLFMIAFTHSLKSTSSDTDVNYGVLTFPKLDEAQEKYLTIPDPSWAMMFCVPKTAADPSFCGFMLEALSATSKETVLNAYYEVSCKIKYTYDANSAEMLDLSLSGMIYDMGLIYDFGGLCGMLKYKIPHKGQNLFSSEYDKLEGKAIKELEKVTAAFNGK